MTRPSPLSEETKAAIREQFRAGVAPKVIAARMTKAGVPVTHWQATKATRDLPTLASIRHRIIGKLRAEGRSRRDIANRIGTTVYAVDNFVRATR